MPELPINVSEPTGPLPKPVFHDPKHHIKIYQGDCLEILAAIPEACVDLIFADQNYGQAPAPTGILPSPSSQPGRGGHAAVAPLYERRCSPGVRGFARHLPVITHDSLVGRRCDPHVADIDKKL